jgi:hypothetical protein
MGALQHWRLAPAFAGCGHAVGRMPWAARALHRKLAAPDQETGSSQRSKRSASGELFPDTDTSRIPGVRSNPTGRVSIASSNRVYCLQPRGYRYYRFCEPCRVREGKLSVTMPQTPATLLQFGGWSANSEAVAEVPVVLLASDGHSLGLQSPIPASFAGRSTATIPLANNGLRHAHQVTSTSSGRPRISITTPARVAPVVRMLCSVVELPGRSKRMTLGHRSATAYRVTN